MGLVFYEQRNKCESLFLFLLTFLFLFCKLLSTKPQITMMIRTQNKKITQDTVSKWARFVKKLKTKNKRYEFIMNLNENNKLENYRL